MTSTAQRLRQVASRARVAQWVAAARLRGIDLKVLLDPTAVIGRDATITFLRGPESTCAFKVGPGSRLESGSLVQLTGGGAVEIGPLSVVRRFAVLNVSGRLVLEGENLVSWHSVIHCAREVVMERQAGTGEGVTVVDGRHFRRHVKDHWYHNSATSPVLIGENAWLASHSTVGPGVTVGPAATVAANSVALTDVPPNSLVAGAPATVVRTSVSPSPLEEA